MKRIALIIPAYNEEKRIGNVLQQYTYYWNQHQDCLVDHLIVLNGCTDNTAGIIKSCQRTNSNIFMREIATAGKGIALKTGFTWALENPSYDHIGFVDADGATSPAAYYELIKTVNGYDGIIASRYMPGSQVIPPRPLYKRWGSKFVYEPLVQALLGLSYHDLQCGAKLFKREVLMRIVNQLKIMQWAIDAEILFLCKQSGFNIKEIPTIWHDQAGSQLKSPIRSGLAMLGTLLRIRWEHAKRK